MIGGPNYLRTCYRDLARITDETAVQTDLTKLPAVPVARRQSHRSMALRSYLEEVVSQLAETDPVSGKKIITVSFISTMHSASTIDMHRTEHRELLFRPFMLCI